MRKHILSVLMLVAAMLVAANNSWAFAKADWKAVPSPTGNGTVEVTEGDTVAAVFTFIGSCSDFDPSKLVIDPVPEGATRGGCKPDSSDSRMATSLWSWKAQQGIHNHTVKYGGSFERTYSFSGKAAYNPSAHPSTEQFEDHVEDDSMHGAGSNDGASFHLGAAPLVAFNRSETFGGRLSFSVNPWGVDEPVAGEFGAYYGALYTHLTANGAGITINEDQARMFTHMVVATVGLPVKMGEVGQFVPTVGIGAAFHALNEEAVGTDANGNFVKHDEGMEASPMGLGAIYFRFWPGTRVFNIVVGANVGFWSEPAMSGDGSNSTVRALLGLDTGLAITWE